MSSGYWQQVQRAGFRVPDDRGLGDLTSELTVMLGSNDPAVRDGTAYPALATWIERGVYDDLLVGLGDGMVAGLLTGLGERDTDTVFRRSFSALVLAECLRRDNAHHLVPATRILDWGDRLATWFLRERDTRGHVAGKGWAHAIAHGADALGVLADSPHLAGAELAVLLDVIAERVLVPGTPPLLSGEPDRLAAAVMHLLRRNVLGLETLESWVGRLAAAADAHDPSIDGDPYVATHNAQTLLRSLFVSLSLAPDPPQVRPDLLLVLVDALRGSNAPFLATPHRR
ncbi:MAG: DUF2785 domain-containing protein [Nocardioides sp.]|nr:DUF2785 domain-containing protein [Nocardioides sp.]